MESKLQFKRRHAENSSSIEAEVDWEEVERTLKEVDPEGTFSDPRFDPLKHALRILGSVAAEKDLNEVSYCIFCKHGYRNCKSLPCLTITSFRRYRPRLNLIEYCFPFLFLLIAAA